MIKSRSGASVEVPGAAAMAEARRRHQLTEEAFLPSTIAIDGASYAAAARSSGRTWEIVDGGRKEIERVQFLIDKRVLSTQPELGEPVTWQSRIFKVVEVSGRSEIETSWLVRAMWMPGI